MEVDRFWLCFICGANAFFLVNHKLIPKSELEDNWKVWKEMVLILGVLLSIALGNLFYGNLIHITDISLSGFVNSAIVTVLLGVFPITLAILNKYQRLLQLNVEAAKQANAKIAEPFTEKISSQDALIKKQEITLGSEIVFKLIAENEKDVFEIKQTELLYIESQDNYSSVVFSQEGKIKRHLLRSSLKRIENQIQSPSVQRCHRAFVVNLSQVSNVEGNAAGYKLRFFDTDIEVPVSRNYGPQVMRYFKTDISSL
jgi:hypothetical protein